MSNRRRGINDDWICCSPQKFIFPTTSRRNPIYLCFYLMAPTSTTRWSRTADAGGIGSMRWGIQCWKGWRKTHAKRRKACGLILHPSRLECTGKRGEGNPSTCQTLCRWARNPKVVRLPVVRYYWERYWPESSTSTFPYPVIGNRKSHIYHRPDCPNYSQVAPKNRVAFNSAAEDEDAGYRVEGDCPSYLRSSP